MAWSLALLHRRFMTSGRLLLAHIRRVAISAVAGLLVLLELFFDRCYLWIGNFLIVPVARGANRNRNIRGEPHQAVPSGDIDVAGSAFLHVLTLAAFVTEHC